MQLNFFTQKIEERVQQDTAWDMYMMTGTSCSFFGILNYVQKPLPSPPSETNVLQSISLPQK